MLKVAVVDDNEVYLDLITKYVGNIFAENSVSFELFKFTLGNEFLLSNDKEKFNVVFLDIMLPDTQGFDVVDKLNENQNNIFVIFITTEEGLVYKGYDYRPFNFVVKESGSSMESRLRQVIKKLIQHIRRFQVITLELPRGEKKEIELSQIVCISSDKNYLNYSIKNSSPVFLRQKMSEIETAFSGHGFFRVHKKHLINWCNVKKINLDDFEIVMTTGDKIPFNKTLKKKIEQEYLLYLRSLR
jgi:two-component system LytT family response regulator